MSFNSDSAKYLRQSHCKSTNYMRLCCLFSFTYIRPALVCFFFFGLFLTGQRRLHSLKLKNKSETVVGIVVLIIIFSFLKNPFRTKERMHWKYEKKKKTEEFERLLTTFYRRNTFVVCVCIFLVCSLVISESLFDMGSQNWKENPSHTFQIV